jgi:hypothetical protein
MNVLIITQTNQDWQTFATWYSVWTNIPNANISIAIKWVKEEVPFRLFQWVKRLKIPHFYTKNIFDDDQANKLGIAIQAKNRHFFNEKELLILTPLTMILKPLPHLSNFLADEHAMFISCHDDIIDDKVLNNSIVDNLCIEAKEVHLLSSIVSYKKGCGRWINKLRGCPFSNAAGLASVEMTQNEHHIINMWKQMTSLYEATA